MRTNHESRIAPHLRALIRHSCDQLSEKKKKIQRVCKKNSASAQDRQDWKAKNRGIRISLRYVLNVTAYRIIAVHQRRIEYRTYSICGACYLHSHRARPYWAEREEECRIEERNHESDNERDKGRERESGRNEKRWSVELWE